MFKLYLASCVILNINYIFFIWFKFFYNLNLIAPSWINPGSAAVSEPLMTYVPPTSEAPSTDAHTIESF